MNKECTCEAWRINIVKLDAPFVHLTVRNPDTYKGYDGALFEYCPWCGETLNTIIRENPPWNYSLPSSYNALKDAT